MQEKDTWIISSRVVRKVFGIMCCFLFVWKVVVMFFFFFVITLYYDVYCLFVCLSLLFFFLLVIYRCHCHYYDSDYDYYCYSQDARSMGTVYLPT